MRSVLQPGQYHGDISRSHQAGFITLTETNYPSGRRLPPHSHERAYFCFVLRGSFTEDYGKHSRVCGPATLIFHPADERHSDHFHAEACCFNVQIHHGYRWQAAPAGPPAVFRGGELPHLAAKLYREFCEMDEVSDLAIEGLALEMTARAARAVRGASRAAPRWLERAREMLHAHYQERITIDRLAAECGVHPTHLAREFRRRQGKTVGEYVRQLRLDFACRELAASDFPIAEIALAGGFFDQSHFTKTFRLHVGMTPGEYRALHRPR